jgi:hypothetical protein
MLRIIFGAVCAALTWMPQTALAQLDCIVPTVESIPGKAQKLANPAFAAIRKAALAAEAIVKQNNPLMTGIHPIRVRTKISYSHEAPWSVTVFTGVYNQEAWIGKCGLVPHADIGSSIRDGFIVININEPRTPLGYPIGDTALEVFNEPTPIAPTAGYPTIREIHGSVCYDNVVMSATGAMPWIPVTIAEALDFEERKLATRLAEWQREKQKAKLSEADVTKCINNMKKVNPAMTEEACGGLRKALEIMRGQRSKEEAEMEAYYTAQTNDLRAYRASFSAAQLQGPARPNGRRDSGIGRVDDPRAKMEVKVDPAYRRLDPTRIHLIFVRPESAMATDTNPVRYQWQLAVNAAINYAALAKLLQ